MRRQQTFLLPVFIVMSVFCGAVSQASAEDWPMWRFDSARSGQSPQTLPDDLGLAWVRQFPAPKPAYRTRRIQFDAGYEPVVLGKTMFVASSHNDSVTALDTETGKTRWRFFTEGPVRLAPVGWKDRVLLGSDDGHLYCLAAADGRLLWKFRAVPSSRKVLGNGRLISLWPVRGGPVLHEGKVYFAAGVWPFEGIFLYSLDAETGEVVWLNDGSGHLYAPHPHNTQALGGLTPQGYLVVNGGELVVPCGQAVPARFDLKTGKLLSFELPKPGRVPGGWFASADVRRGEVVLDAALNRDLHEDKVYQGPGEPDVMTTVRAGGQSFTMGGAFPGVDGQTHTILAADQKLFVVTHAGAVYCFAQKPAHANQIALSHEPLRPRSGGDYAFLEQLIGAAGDRNGYALVLGAADPALLEKLLKETEFHVIAIDPDGEKIAALRDEFDAAGLYGSRIALHVAKAGEVSLPPYLASLAVFNDAGWFADREGAAIEASDLEILRPYGGTACLRLSDGEHARLVSACRRDNSFTVERAAGLTIIRRGGLAGAANYTGGWTSSEQRVRAPLGVLWFDDTLGHFKRSPQPMFFNGVMVSYVKDWMARHREGRKVPYDLLPPVLSDVYTGRVLKPDEKAAAWPDLPKRDIAAAQPNQYRPPYQKDDWSPGQPEAGERVNPLTGETERRTFPKDYGCDGGVDYGALYTMRSGTAAFYDKQVESGTCYISGPRSGCTNSVIPACGLLNVPYFYEGCTCAYPLPCGLALVSMPPEHEQWAAWGEGKAENIGRVGINFGAPGDRMTEDGTLWLDWPSRGGPSPEVRVAVEPSTADFYYHHSIWIKGGNGWPWVAASGLEGALAVKVSGLRTAAYTVRLYFAEPDQNQPGQRVFDILLNGNAVAERFDVVKAAGGCMRGTIQQFENIPVKNALEVTLKPHRGRTIVSGIELIANSQ